MFTHVEVMSFNFTLGAFYGARDHAGFNGFFFGNIEHAHDFLNAFAVENAQEIIFKT